MKATIDHAGRMEFQKTSPRIRDKARNAARGSLGKGAIAIRRLLYGEARKERLLVAVPTRSAALSMGYSRANPKNLAQTERSGIHLGIALAFLRSELYDRSRISWMNIMRPLEKKSRVGSLGGPR